MAKIIYSNLVNDISGSVGGNIFSRNASGGYVKAKVQPTNPNTARQQAVRASFGVNAGLWRGLTAAQQQLWIDSAPNYPYVDNLGNSRTYTGSVLFNKLNQTLAVLGIAALNSPKIPVSLSSVAIGALTMTLTAGVLTAGTVAYTGVGTSDEALIISMTPGLSNGITRPGKSAFRQILIVADASTISPADIATAYQTLYGDPQLGAKVFVRMELVSRLTGQRLGVGQSEATVSGT